VVHARRRSDRQVRILEVLAAGAACGDARVEARIPAERDAVFGGDLRREGRPVVDATRKFATGEPRVEEADVTEGRKVQAVCAAGKNVVGNFALEPAVARVAAVLEHGLGRRDDDRLDAVLEVDPEQARIIEQAINRRAVNARFPRQGLGRVGNAARVNVRKGRGDIEETDWPIALADAEIGLVLMAEVEARAEAEHRHSPARRLVDQRAHEVGRPDALVDAYLLMFETEGWNDMPAARQAEHVLGEDRSVVTVAIL